MNLNQALVVGLSLWTLCACGPAKEAVPCSGDGCLDVAGSYSVSVNSPPEGNSCKRIQYTAGENFPLAFTITQTGPDLVFSIDGSLRFTIPGTLYEDASASFKKHLDHIVVRGSVDYDYADDAQVTLQFSPSNDVLFVSGGLSDALSANADPVPGDELCTLNASISGQR